MAIRRHRYASRFNRAWDTSPMRKARNPNWQRTTIVRSRLNMYWSQRSARNQPGNQVLRLRARVWQRWSKMIIIMTTIIYLLIREHWTYIYATKAYTISHHIITCPSYHSIPSKVITSYFSSFQVICIYIYIIIYIYVCIHIYIYIICHISYQFPSVPIGSHQFPSAQPPECIATQDSKPGGKPSKMARFNHQKWWFHWSKIDKHCGFVHCFFGDIPGHLG